MISEQLQDIRDSLSKTIEFTKPLSNFGGYWRLAQGPHELIPNIQKIIDDLDIIIRNKL